MDILIALLAFYEALDDGETEAAAEHAENIHDWLSNGGFAPVLPPEMDFHFLFDGEPASLSAFLKTMRDPESDTDPADLYRLLSLKPGETSFLGGGAAATFTISRPAETSPEAARIEQLEHELRRALERLSALERKVRRIDRGPHVLPA